VESKDPLRPELRKILTIIADLSHNNTEASIQNNKIVEESQLLPHEVNNYLDELKSKGLIKELLLDLLVPTLIF
jgi:predicted transcriptional regulator